LLLPVWFCSAVYVPRSATMLVDWCCLLLVTSRLVSDHLARNCHNCLLLVAVVSCLFLDLFPCWVTGLFAVLDCDILVIIFLMLYCIAHVCYCFLQGLLVRESVCVDSLFILQFDDYLGFFCFLFLRVRFAPPLLYYLFFLYIYIYVCVSTWQRIKVCKVCQLWHIFFSLCCYYALNTPKKTFCKSHLSLQCNVTY
jgi:hypothetical protein